MNKRIISLLLAVVMVFALALPVLAANGINKDEEALLSKFKSIVNTHSELLGDALVAQYNSEAENALIKADLNKDACSKLSAAMDKVDSILGEVKTKEQAKAKLSEILGIVNSAAQEYGIKVSVNSSTGVASVTVNGEKVATSKDSPVNQTGINMTATYAVIALLVIALGYGIITVRKEKLIARG